MRVVSFGDCPNSAPAATLAGSPADFGKLIADETEKCSPVSRRNKHDRARTALPPLRPRLICQGVRRGLDGSHLFSIQNNSGPPQGFLVSHRGRLRLQHPAAWVFGLRRRRGD
jgi:hypothetical protein